MIHCLDAFHLLLVFLKIFLVAEQVFEPPEPLAGRNCVALSSAINNTLFPNNRSSQKFSNSSQDNSYFISTHNNNAFEYAIESAQSFQDLVGTFPVSAKA